MGPRLRLQGGALTRLSLLVDTSVWSLALRRDSPPPLPEVDELRRALEAGAVYSTGLVLQELLQGFPKASARKQIIKRFAALPLLVPDRDDMSRLLSYATRAAETVYRSARLMLSWRSYVFVTS